MDTIGSKLSKKVKTPYHPIAKSYEKDKYFVVIDGVRFNTVYVDSDIYYLYFYLERVGDFTGNIEPE